MHLLRAAEWAGLCLFVLPALLVDLRLLGAIASGIRVSALVRAVLPWTATGFAVMAAARALRLVATPGDLIGQPVFIAHLLLLALLGVNVALFHRGVFRRVDGWDRGDVPPRARATGVVSLVLFTGIVGTAWLIR